jgi:hypothetical protein
MIFEWNRTCKLGWSEIEVRKNLLDLEIVLKDAYIRNNRASASNIEKMAKKFKNLQFFIVFSKPFYVFDRVLAYI